MDTNKALTIIKQNKIYTANQFAQLYFKGEDILEKTSNIGNGATKGVGAWFVAGRILSNLKKKGLIDGGLYSIYKSEYFVKQSPNN